MKPLGYHMRADVDVWTASRGRHRRWETVEIDRGVEDYADAGCLCCEFIPTTPAELEDEETAWREVDLEEMPRTPLRELFVCK